MIDERALQLRLAEYLKNISGTIHNDPFYVGMFPEHAIKMVVDVVERHVAVPSTISTFLAHFPEIRACLEFGESPENFLRLAGITTDDKITIEDLKMISQDNQSSIRGMRVEIDDLNNKLLESGFEIYQLQKENKRLREFVDLYDEGAESADMMENIVKECIDN